MSVPPRAVYRWSCPNCGGPNTEERLSRGLPCRLCLPEPPRGEMGIREIAEALRRRGSLKRYAELEALESESLEMMRFFEQAVGSRPWGAQRTWIRRLVRGDSFSIVAPTGVGKTTFGVASSLYFACRRGERSYIVLPTTALVLQVEERARLMMERLECRARLVAFRSRMPQRARRELLERIEAGEFDVLVTTAAFALRKLDLVAKHRYRLVFVDDVDAVLKSGRSVNMVLRLAGFSEEDLELGVRLLRLQARRAALLARLIRLQASGRMQAVEEIRRDLDRIEGEIRRIEEKLAGARRRAASLVVSTATGRPRGARVRLFRSLLGFEAGGGAAWGLRRVYDLYTHPSDGVYQRVVDLVRGRLGDGGLVYVPIDHGVEGAERLAEMLRAAGVRAAAYHSRAPQDLLEEYRRGELEVLVGVANYYGLLVRGLDMPERVRYAVFAGVPRHRFPADVGEPHPARLIRLLSLLVEAPMRDLAEQARHYMVRLRNILRRLSPAALRLLAERVMQGDVDGPGSPAWILAEAYNFLRQALQEEEVWEYLAQRRDVAIDTREGKRYILIADAPTYIQASGRTSRLYAGGITRGVSVVVVDYEPVFNGLVRRTRLYIDAEWRRLEDVDLDAILREVDEDRERVRRVRRGEAGVEDLVRTALLVVESPNKARTIAGFFGQPSIRLLPGGARVYEVTTGRLILSIVASGGHVYDLAQWADARDLEAAGMSREQPLDVFSVLVTPGREAGNRYTPVYTSIKRCLDCGYQFTAEASHCPRCGSTRIRDGRTIVEDIRRLAWEVDEVLVGTDPDMEGEKIGWDIASLIRTHARSIRRIEFHEVTKPAILRAIEEARSFDQRLVDSQVVRRIEDRWIGYTLSPLLWCHFWKHYYCRRLLEERPRRRGPFLRREIERCRSLEYYYNLSAGRVQTPVLGWVVERTKEAAQKVFSITFYIRLEGETYTITARGDEIEDPLGELPQLFRGARKAGGERRNAAVLRGVDIHVEVLESKPTTLAPPPPYSTDTLILDASRLLGLGAPETMRLAQNLFEWGLITYHRTDSIRVSEKGMQVARQWLSEKFPEDWRDLYKPRKWAEGGAHEAIRPTRPIDAETLRNMVNEGILDIQGLTEDHLRLYDLIFRRFMASQMREAEAEWRRLRLKLAPHEIAVVAEGAARIGEPGRRASAGFALVWVETLKRVPPVGPGYVSGDVLIKKVSKVPLYSEGELVEEMRKRGIGRPSTYAKIVDTLLRRRYITRLPRPRDRVRSTVRGELVHLYLTRDIVEELSGSVLERLSPEAQETIRSIPSLVTEERTRFLESRLRQIEEGALQREPVLDEIYQEIRGLSVPISLAMKNLEGPPPVPPELWRCLKGFRLAMGHHRGVNSW